MNNAFFSPAFWRFRTIAYLSLTKTINPFIPETSLPARDKSQSNSWRNKRKEKKESSMSFPRVNFWNSLTHLLSSASAWQGSIEWIFKIILNEITKFPRLLFFQSIDSRNTIYRISFPYAFFYHSLVSSNSSFKTTGNRSFCRNAFHPSSIFVSFRLIDLSPRISVEESFPGEGNGGGEAFGSTNDRPLFPFLSRFTR